MPPIPAVPGVVRMTWHQAIEPDVNVQNRLYYRFTGTMGAADALALATAGASAWNSHIAPQISNTVGLTDCEALDLTEGSAGDATFPTSYAGTQEDPPVPTQVTLNVKGDVERRYRGGKPRWYQSGCLATYVVNGTAWDSTFLEGFVVAFTDFTNENIGFTSDDISLEAGSMVSFYSGFTSVENPVTHRYRNIPTLRTVPLVTDIASWSGDVRLGSQRRRRTL